MEATHWPKLLLLLVAAVASGLLVLRSDGDAPNKPRAPTLGIGYYMKNAELVVTGDSGRALYRLQTEHATQIAENGVIELEPVRVSYDPLQEAPWDLLASKGHILPDGNIIRLTGDVIAMTRGDIRPSIRIGTEFLELDTDTYIASTDKDVAIDYTNNKVFATGLRAYLKEDRLQLISNVNGVYLP